jgi:hypothetical protein
MGREHVYKPRGVGGGARVRSSTLPIRAGVVAGGLPEKPF